MSETEIISGATCDARRRDRPMTRDAQSSMQGTQERRKAQVRTPQK